MNLSEYITKIFKILPALFICIAFHIENASAQKKFEEAARVLYESGKNLYQTGEYEKALENLEKAYQIIKNPYIEFYIARCCQKLGRFQDALNYWELASGKFTGAYQEELEAGKELCKIKLSDFPQDTPDHRAAHLFFEQGISAFDSGNVKEAINLFEKSLSLAPDIAIIRYYLGKSFFQEGICEKAMLQFHAMNKIKPEFEIEIERLKKTCSLSSEIKTGTEEALMKKLFLLFRTGVESLYDGKLNDAEKTFGGAFELQDNFKIKLLVADFYFEMKAYSSAAALYRSLYKKIPAYDSIIQAKIEECSVLLSEKKEKFNPDEIISLYRTGKKYLLEKNYAKSLEIFEKHQGNVYFMFYLGKIHYETLNYKDAIKYLSAVEKALPEMKDEIRKRLDVSYFALNDTNSEPDKEIIYRQFLKAKQFYENGGYDEAAVILKDYVKNPYVVFYLARINMLQKNYNDAFNEWLSIKGKLPEYSKEIDQGISKCQANFGTYYSKRKQGWIFTSTGGAMMLVSGFFLYSYMDASKGYDSSMKKYNSAFTEEDAQKYRKSVSSYNSRMKLNSILSISAAGAGVLSLAYGLYQFITLPEKPVFQKSVELVPVFDGKNSGFGFYFLFR
jgi:tetratricopeptide (TPR) repeat protein